MSSTFIKCLSRFSSVSDVFLFAHAIKKLWRYPKSDTKICEQSWKKKKVRSRKKRCFTKVITAYHELQDWTFSKIEFSRDWAHQPELEAVKITAGNSNRFVRKVAHGKKTWFPITSTFALASENTLEKVQRKILEKLKLFSVEKSRFQFKFFLNPNFRRKQFEYDDDNQKYLKTFDTLSRDNVPWVLMITS